MWLSRLLLFVMIIANTSHIIIYRCTIAYVTVHAKQKGTEGRQNGFQDTGFDGTHGKISRNFVF